MTSKNPSFLERNRDAVVVGLLCVAVLLIYGQTAGFQFINLDDNYYIQENPAVLSGLNWSLVKWAFTTFHAANWHPLTWMSLALDVSLFGPSPGKHHVMNVIFHLANSLLAFVVFRRMTAAFWPSAMIALLFAIHPMHVESVAWITERKDLLSTAFWFGSMWFYIGWTKSGGMRKYAIALVMFACALMSKPMAITLPFVFLLCDVWPLERIKTIAVKRLLIEKLPFFALSIASAYVTVAAQRSQSAVESLSALPAITRIENAIVAYVKYIASAFVPTGLAVWYPYEKEIGLITVLVSAVILIAITALCIRQFEKRKYLLIGWLWFVGTLVPVIGIVQVGGQSMADRYTYIPYFGLFVMIVFAVAELDLDRRLITAVAAVVLIAFTISASVQTSYWRDNEALYTRALSVTENNFLIENNYCHALMQMDRLDEAEELCRRSLEHRPNFFEALNTQGIISFKRGDYPAAERYFESAIQSGNALPLSYMNLAQAEILQGKAAEGEAHLQSAVQLSGTSVPPATFVTPLTMLVDAYIKEGNFGKAAENLRRLKFVRPDSVDIRLKLVETLIALEQFGEAESEVNAILKADQKNAAAWNAMGLISLGRGEKAKAADSFRKALELRPDYSDAKENLRKAES
jgi:Flp pilus assembly protein TadD